MDDSVAVAQGHHQLSLMPGGPVVVIGDPERLAQVAHNLVRNALAHTPAGTKVGVSTRAQAGMGVIEVSDNGPGIPPEEAARVFDRFYQGDKSRSGSRHRARPGHRARHRRGTRRDGRGAGRSRAAGPRSSSASRWPRSNVAARSAATPPTRSAQIH